MNKISAVNFIVVPDGLSVDEKGRVLAEPSFVYQSTLDALVTLAKERDSIWLAPANHFGSNITEQEAAKIYLKKKRVTAKMTSIKSNTDKYIDTRGNAKLLKVYLKKSNLWPLDNAVLVAYSIHMPRSKLAFEQEGFCFSALISACSHNDCADKRIVRRLFYYKYKGLHHCYELLLRFIYLIRLK